MGLGKDIRAAI